MSDSGSRPGYERCGARKRSDGKPCGLPAGHGTGHVGTGRCRRHGGNTPTHVASGREAQARAAAGKFALPVVTRAVDALQDELNRTAGVIVYLEARIQGLPEEELSWGVEKRSIKSNPGQGAQAGVPQVEVTHSAKTHVLVLQLERERKHFASVAADMVRIGVEERTVRVLEAQVIQLARTIRAILVDLDEHLCPVCQQTQRALIPTVVPRRIRELAA